MNQKILDMRFKDRKAIERVTRACQFTEVTTGRDERGLFFTNYTAPKWFTDLPDVSTITPVAERAPRSAPVKGDKSDGICAQIRAWSRDNPDATKFDALAHFVGVNPTTVGIQFRKGRL